MFHYNLDNAMFFIVNFKYHSLQLALRRD